MEVEQQIKEISRKNPSAILDAVTSPSPLTISQIAILEKMSSPLLYQDVTKLGENIKATYIVNIPYKDAVKQIKADELEGNAMEWADELGWDKFQEKFGELLVGLLGFWKMLPPQESEEAQKKKTEHQVK